MIGEMVGVAPDGLVGGVNPRAVLGQAGAAVPGGPGVSHLEDPFDGGGDELAGVGGAGNWRRGGHESTVGGSYFGEHRTMWAVASRYGREIPHGGEAAGHPGALGHVGGAAGRSADDPR